MSVEITGQKAEVTVGEKIDLGARMKPGSVGIVKRVEWKIPGRIVESYNGDGSRHVRVGTFEDANKKRTSPPWTISFHWVDGGDGRTVEAKITYEAGGAETTKTVSVTIDVKRPELDHLTSATDSVGLAPRGSPTHLRFGVSGAGITWDWKISSNGAAEGEIKDIQLILLDRHQVLSAAGKKKQVHTVAGRKTPPGVWMLDSENPYGSKAYWGATLGGPWALPSGGSVSDTGIGDSPGMGLAATRSAVSFDDQFKYYLVYRSNETNAIWVPIGMLPWSCKGKATESGGSWTLVAGSAGNAKNPKGSETFDFPEWGAHVALDDLSWEDE